jgi:leucine dehydrogenase
MTMLFDHPAHDGHESVLFARDTASSLRAIIAVHSTAAGPACGGVRFWHYVTEADALTDVLRLSKGMSYKNVMAGLPLGGGKAVILADAQRTKSRELLRAFGRAVDRLGGAYIAAEDVGITVDDVAAMREATRHVAGKAKGVHASGDPSPFTARGVFLGLHAAVRFQLGTDSLKGLRVGVLGLGAVGMKLAGMLHETGAKLVVADIDRQRVREAERAFGAEIAAPDLLPVQPLDVLSPCALGGVLSPEAIEKLRATVVAGAANNQLVDAAYGRLLHEKGVLYAPDYVINAGGIINVAGEVLGDYDEDKAIAAVERIPETLWSIFETARATDRPTSAVADQIAAERLAALAAAPGVRHAA